MGKKVLAFDFGASSGRAVVGDYNGDRLTLAETHRFSNDPVTMGGTFYWDIVRFMYDIKLGINKSSREAGPLASIGIDTWGVDFGLLDAGGRLMENPVHYRDGRTQGIPEEVFKTVSKKELYDATGIQLLDFNTVFQLYYLATRRPGLLEDAESLLFMPDLLNYFLTGNKVTEYSVASTSELLNPYSRDWDRELIKKLGIPGRLFGGIAEPGTKVGALLPSICEELGVPSVDVYTVAGHDTGSAVAAVPARPGENYAYLSCGTWSLLGVETQQPIITDKSFAYNYTNEGGYGKKIRVLKNIVGLWLMQECKRQWEREGATLSFKDIDKLTVNAKPLKAFIDPAYAPFSQPGNMPARIADYCRRTGQTPPEEKGEFSRCIAESLALKYRQTFEELETVRGGSIDALHIIGGGVKDKFVCQYTANALKKPVYAGPVEATALGNVAVQLIATGEVKNLDEARELIRRSFPVEVYEPQDVALWDDAYNRFLAIQGRE